MSDKSTFDYSLLHDDEHEDVDETSGDDIASSTVNMIDVSTSTESFTHRKRLPFFKSKLFIVMSSQSNTQDNSHDRFYPEFSRIHLCQLISHHRGHVVSDTSALNWNKIKALDQTDIFLVTDGYSISKTYLTAVSAGIPRVHYHWILDIVQTGIYRDFFPYLLPNGRSLVSDELMFWRNKTLKIFTGMSFALVPLNDDKSNELIFWTKLLKLEGAKVFEPDYFKDSDTNWNYLLIDSLEGDEITKLEKKGKIVTMNYIIESTIIGKQAQINAHPLFTRTVNSCICSTILSENASSLKKIQKIQKKATKITKATTTDFIELDVVSTAALRASDPELCVRELSPTFDNERILASDNTFPSIPQAHKSDIDHEIDLGQIPTRKIFKGQKFLVLPSQSKLRTLTFLAPRIPPYDLFRLKNQITAGGGRILTENDEIDWVILSSNANKRDNMFVVTDDLSGEPVYLMAVAAGVRCVSYEWIINCCHRLECDDPEFHLLPAGVSYVYGWEIDWHGSVGALRGISLAIVSQHNSHKYWNYLATVADASCVSLEAAINLAHNGYEVAIVVVDSYSLDGIIGHGIPIVNTAWIIESVVSGSKAEYTHDILTWSGPEL